MKKAIAFGLIFISIILTGYNSTNISEAKITNLTTAVIKMDNLSYLMTDIVVTTNEVEEQIGEVTQIYAVVSYPEDRNPYKNPSKIFKIKDIRVKEAIAIQVNGKLYIANIND